MARTRVPLSANPLNRRDNCSPPLGTIYLYKINDLILACALDVHEILMGTRRGRKSADRPVTAISRIVRNFRTYFLSLEIGHNC